MEITLTALHWCYLVGVLFVLAAMIMRKDVVVPCAIFTMISGFIASGSFSEAVLTQAKALMFA